MTQNTRGRAVGPHVDSLGLNLRRVTTPSGEISFIDEGPSAAAPVLLLHGSPFSSLAYVRLIRSLQRRHRVLAPDLPGFGRSVAAPDFGGSLSDYAASIREFWEALDLRDITLFGCDSTSCAGLSAAATTPDRIARLVIADTVPIPLTGRFRMVRFALRHVVGSRPMLWVNRRLNLLPWLVATVDPFLCPFSLRERKVLTGQYDTPSKRDRVLCLLAALGRDDAFLRRTADETRARLTEKPVLLTYGQFDPMRLLGAIPRYRAMFAHADVYIVPREKHFPFLAAGERVGGALADWIEARPSRRDPAELPAQVARS